MRILIAHNRYQQPGGEDAVVKTEFNLLKDFGEEVRLYERTNDEINHYSVVQKINFLWNMGWSEDSYNDIRRVLKEFSPEVVHFHNIFFTLTPSVYQACRDEDIPVVQSLHNFRLLCSNGLFFRNNKVCEECLDHKNLWRGVYYGCYRNSRLMTALMVRMLKDHWDKRTWLDQINLYIAFTEFSRCKYITAGIPPEKIAVKPHVNPNHSSWENSDKGYALFVGRLAPEKGVKVLLEAWKKRPLLPLKIVGDGPLATELKKEAQNIKQVEFLGFVSQDRCGDYMKGAKFLLIPSLCYENFTRVVAESYSYGIPVLASSLGGFPEVVLDKETGLLFRPGDADDLLTKIEWFLSHENYRSSMQQNIRKVYATTYGARKNYETLMDIYKKAITNKKIDRGQMRTSQIML